MKLQKPLSLVLALALTVTPLLTAAYAEDSAAETQAQTATAETAAAAGETAGTTADPATDGDEGDTGIMPMPLLPLDMRKAYIYLTGYTADDLKEFTLSDFLKGLLDENGAPINIPADAKIAWGMARSPVTDSQDFDLLDADAVLDLTGTDPSDPKQDIAMMLIVGNGSQMD